MAQSRLAAANLVSTHTGVYEKGEPKSSTAPVELASGPYQVKAFEDLHNKSTHQHCHASLGTFVCSSHRRGNGGCREAAAIPQDDRMTSWQDVQD